MNAPLELTREDLALLEALEEACAEQRLQLHRELETDSAFAREFRGVEETVLEVDAAFCEARSFPIVREPWPLSARALARLEGAQKELIGGLPARLMKIHAPAPPIVLAPLPDPEAALADALPRPAPRFVPRHGGSWAAWAAAVVVLGAFAVIYTNRPKPPPDAGEIVEPVDPPPASRGPAEPPPEVAAPDKVVFQPADAETRRVKGEVLARIDLMDISQSKKDQLYMQVERTRRMAKVLTIPFGKGATGVSATHVQAMNAELKKPELTALRDDLTAVFVILGFADTKGNPAQNLFISQQRAETVLKAMRDKCGVSNVLHSLGMGGSTLLDAEHFEKNRIAEVWAVLP